MALTEITNDQSKIFHPTEVFDRNDSTQLYKCSNYNHF